MQNCLFLRFISPHPIEVYPPFRKSIDYPTSNGPSSVTFDRFFNHSNFTASFNEIVTLATSNYSQSYAVFDLANIQPEVGDVGAVEISYKSLNLIGSNYQPLGTFEIKSENLLIDSASVFFQNPEGIVETPIGNFRSGLSSFNAYWATSSIGPTFPTASVSSRIVDGIRIDYGYRFSTGSFVVIEPKSQYKINLGGENTQINLSFDSFSESDLTNILPQLDVYISGSEIITEPIQESIQLSPLISSSFGTYIGSISQTFGKLRKNSLTFVAKTPGNILPKLISRVGKWHIGNFEIRPVDEKGFNCNQTRIYAPMTLPTGSEVNFKIDYLNPAGRKSQNYSSLIEGVYFSGNYEEPIPGLVSASSQLMTGSNGQIPFFSGSTGYLTGSNNFTFDVSQRRLNVTASLFLTGSTSTRMSYTWDGPKTLGAYPGIVWTNMPLTTTTWLGTAGATSDAHYIGDFTEVTQGRLFTVMGAAAASTSASLQVHFSLDGATNWQTMLSTTIGNSTGIKDSGWTSLPTGSKQFVYIRLIGLNGDGATDPRFSPPIALFR